MLMQSKRSKSSLGSEEHVSGFQFMFLRMFCDIRCSQHINWF